MDIEALRSFVAFVETGSFTRTAKQVHRTQSAVSMQMKKLEEQVGKPLFTKYGRNLILSYDGQRLAPFARNLVEMHDNTLSRLQAETPTVKIRLGCPDDYADSVLPQFCRLMHQQWPQLDLQITAAPSHRIRVMLDSHHLDAGIVTRAPTTEEGYLLQSDQGVWVYSPLYRHLMSSDPLPLVLFQPDCKFHQAAIDGLIKQNRKFKVMASAGSASVLCGLVSHGLGIGAMANSSLSPGLEKISDDSLPRLPVIDVALVLCGRKENPFTEIIAQQLCSCYQSENRKIPQSDKRPEKLVD